MHIQKFSLTILHQIENLNKQRCNLNHDFIILYQNLTFAVWLYKTFFLYTVGKNSPLLYKRITYIIYAVGKDSPMA